MGRRKQSPEEQKAKGFPGRRRRAVEAEIKTSSVAPDPEETLLASLDIDGLRPPRRFLSPKGAEALAIWKAVVPRLKATARASAEFGPALVAYCDSVARYNRAVEDIEAKGLTVETPMTGGEGVMLRLNPAEKVREKALAEILTISERFGFTPRDNFNLLLDHRKVIESGAGGRQGSLFQPASASDEASAPQQDASPIGGMDAFDSAPPQGLPN